MDTQRRVTRILRVLGVLLVLGAVAMAGWTLLIELDDGYATSSAGSSLCNYQQCSPGQLQSMMRIVGPVTVAILLLFGIAMLKAKVSPAEPEPAKDTGARLAALDTLRASSQIDEDEYAAQRRRILSSV